ncbi:hypothetical protein MJO28_009247 [Puccinia striiformis f. sp. tritici]|uniref:Uncharacterized protein n=1 Tax=Puccinia striiformis f. sp. tritici TaxID=168172 RepID=A0ACC0E6P7_9BASI|nr:hypothetical protein Pst134EA_017825 [Puccinia striiformis f. sp. tritici]KAH9461524.1 hypothetical protein Pst134EA_017825 [Puccinia striiformis f. sp. tritici]KAI7947339.1 hypothetical protein MJO28_009247 [Puccinia striiformis f. sp. tritici]
MNVTSLGMRARDGSSIRLSPLVCFASNGTLVALMFIPGALLLWRSIDGACAIRAIEDNSRKVIAHLLQSAPTYRPESYSYLSVVGIVKPLAAIVPYKERFAHDLRFMLYLFLVQHSLIAVIYLPLFIIVLRILRRQISPKESRENGFAGDHTPKEMNAIDRVRKRLIKHACLVYLQEILYCPPVVYLMFGPTTKVSKLSDPTWILVLQVGVHGPTAIIGNIILAFLIQNAVYAHKKHHELSIAPVNIQPESVPEDEKSHKVSGSTLS